MLADGCDRTAHMKNVNEYFWPRNWKRDQQRNELNVTHQDGFCSVRLVEITSVRERNAHEQKKTKNATENTDDADSNVLLLIWTFLTTTTQTVKTVIGRALSTET